MRNVSQTEARLIAIGRSFLDCEAREPKKAKADLCLAALEYGKAKAHAQDKRDAWKRKKRMKV
jgi:hypothetical protein